jgi:hypothetical protein
MAGGSGFFVTLLIDVVTQSGAKNPSKKIMIPPYRHCVRILSGALISAAKLFENTLKKKC